MTLRTMLLRRLVISVPLLIGILFFTFMLVRLGGQDPVGLLAGPTATAEEIDIVRAELGLDKPLFTQFWIYLGNIVQGDIGKSWISNRSVLLDILERIPITLELLFWGVALGSVIGVPVGLRAAFRHDKWFDQISRGISLLGFSIPTYFLGLVLLFVFFFLLGWSPPGMGRVSLLISPPPTITGSYLIDGLLAGDWSVARSALAQLILPVIAVAIISAAPIVKHTRAIALEVMSSDFVRFARASGLPPKKVSRIVLRNSSTPVATFIGTEITGLIGSVSLIEYVFAWGGAGQYGLNAIIRGDFSAVQGYVLFLAIFSLVVFILVDLLVLVLEPRAAAE
ncbi:MAG: ABC transporter permease [Rhodospirillaceae bacterium]|nr:ABC transporter permease [Rhodospirillaceae bacterium]